MSLGQVVRELAAGEAAKVPVGTWCATKPTPGGWSYNGSTVEAGECVRLAGETYDARLLLLRYLTPIEGDGFKPHRCKQCRRAFLNAVSLRVHQTRHEDPDGAKARKLAQERAESNMRSSYGATPSGLFEMRARR